MRVDVDEAGHDELATCIDDLCCARRCDVRLDRGDAAGAIATSRTASTRRDGSMTRPRLDQQIVGSGERRCMRLSIAAPAAAAYRNSRRSS